MRIFDLHTSKARYELKLVLLHFWRVNVKTIGGFFNIPLADLAHINLRHNNFTILEVGRDSTFLQRKDRRCYACRTARHTV